MVHSVHYKADISQKTAAIRTFFAACGTSFPQRLNAIVFINVTHSH